LRLTILAMIGALIVAASVVFVLLFLDVPKGWSPGPGFAPLIGDVYQRAFSFPHHELTPDQYTYASMGTLLAAWTLWGAALWLLARRTGSDYGLGALALYAWSPLALVESAVGAHLESLIALALGGLLLAERKRVEGAFALLLMSAAVKYVSAIVGVLYFVHAVAAEPDARRRLACGGRLLATAAIVLAVLYAPFWEGPDMLSLAVEHLTGGRNLAPSAEPVRSVPAVVIAGVALLAGASLVVVARGRLERVAEMSAAVILAFLLFVFQYKFAWYFLSALALTAARPPTPTNRVLLMLSVTWGLLLMFTYAVLSNVAHPGM
jgi:hypothetical protein